MKKWFNSLSAREKRMVSGCGVIVAVFFAYFIFWAPMSNVNAQLNGQVQYNESLIKWMQQVNQKIQALPQRVVEKQHLSLEAIQAALQASGVNHHTVSLTQNNQNSFVLTIKNVEFDRLITAIIQLQQHSKMQIQTLHLKQQNSGFVTGLVTLDR